MILAEMLGIFLLACIAGIASKARITRLIAETESALGNVEWDLETSILEGKIQHVQEARKLQKQFRTVSRNGILRALHVWGLLFTFPTRVQRLPVERLPLELQGFQERAGFIMIQFLAARHPILLPILGLLSIKANREEMVMKRVRALQLATC